MMARDTNVPLKGRIQKRKTVTSKSSLSACNARPVHTDVPLPLFRVAKKIARLNRSILWLPTSGWYDNPSVIRSPAVKLRTVVALLFSFRHSVLRWPLIGVSQTITLQQP